MKRDSSGRNFSRVTETPNPQIEENLSSPLSGLAEKVLTPNRRSFLTGAGSTFFAPVVPGINVAQKITSVVSNPARVSFYAALEGVMYSVVNEVADSLAEAIEFADSLDDPAVLLATDAFEQTCQNYAQVVSDLTANGAYDLNKIPGFSEMRRGLSLQTGTLSEPLRINFQGAEEFAQRWLSGAKNNVAMTAFQTFGKPLSGMAIKMSDVFNTLKRDPKNFSKHRDFIRSLLEHESQESLLSDPSFLISKEGNLYRISIDLNKFEKSLSPDEVVVRETLVDVARMKIDAICEKLSRSSIQTPALGIIESKTIQNEATDHSMALLIDPEGDQEIIKLLESYV